MPGPASLAATRPVITKMPAPMMAPTPSEVRPIGPRMRRSRFSPRASASSISSDLVAKSCLQDMRTSGGAGWPEPPQEVHRDAAQDDQEARPAEDRLDQQQ